MKSKILSDELEFIFNSGLPVNIKFQLYRQLDRLIDAEYKLE